ncbi:MAG: thioesterase family protein [Anaerolineae bacterium]|nr:thioesterase family protein [Anaerolineae bacterium]
MPDEGRVLPAIPEARVLQSPGGPVVETWVRVRYAETDAMGVVYHAHYIIWFEVGRGAYWRALCTEGEAARMDAGSFPVAAVEAHYHASARYGDLVTIRTWVHEMRSRSVTFGYECRLEATGQRLAVGRSTHLFLDAEGHARRLPEGIRLALLGRGRA